MSRVNRTLARLRLCRMRMRRQGKLTLQGYTPPRDANVEETWRRHGWVKPTYFWDYNVSGWRPRRATILTDVTVREAA